MRLLSVRHCASLGNTGDPDRDVAQTRMVSRWNDLPPMPIDRPRSRVLRVQSCLEARVLVATEVDQSQESQNRRDRPARESNEIFGMLLERDGDRASRHEDDPDPQDDRAVSLVQESQVLGIDQRVGDAGLRSRSIISPRAFVRHRHRGSLMIAGDASG
jgi:hypothetical protein